MFWNYYCLWCWYYRVCISFLSTLYLFLSFCYTDFALGVIYFWCFLSLLVFLSLIFLRDFLVLILHVFCRWNKYFWSLDLYFCVLLWIGYFDFYCFLACLYFWYLQNYFCLKYLILPIRYRYYYLLRVDYNCYCCLYYSFYMYFVSYFLSNRSWLLFFVLLLMIYCCIVFVEYLNFDLLY